MRRALAIGLTASMLVLSAGHAAETDERDQTIHRAARNQLGLLQFCRSQGLTDDAAVAAQRHTVDALRSVPAGGLDDQEEEAGRLGYLAFGKRQAAFAESATAQGLTLSTACQGRAAVALAGR